MRLTPILAAVTIGLFATAAMAQNRDPGSAPPGVSATGGKPVPVGPAEVRRDKTSSPGVAPSASTTGGKPVPVNPAEVKRQNAIPGAAPTSDPQNRMHDDPHAPGHPDKH